MNFGPALTALVWGLGVVGLVLVVTKPGQPWRRLTTVATRLRVSVLRWRMPIMVGVGAALITRWVAVGALAALVAWSLPDLVADTRRAREARLARREAVAKWLEMLSDGFAAGGFLQSTILATEDTAPPAIAGDIACLCSDLRGGEDNEPRPFDEALAAFANRFADPDIDRIAVALVLAVRGQARDLSRVIRNAAAMMRERVAVDRRIEAGPRAWIYLEVRFTEALMAVVGIVLLLRVPVLRPLGTAAGQLYVTAVGVTALLLLRSLAKQARPAPQPRLLTIAGDR